MFLRLRSWVVELLGGDAEDLRCLLWAKGWDRRPLAPDRVVDMEWNIMSLDPAPLWGTSLVERMYPVRTINWLEDESMPRIVDSWGSWGWVD